MHLCFALLEESIKTPSPKYLQTDVRTPWNFSYDNAYIWKAAHCVALSLLLQSASWLDNLRCQEQDTLRCGQMYKISDSVSIEQNFSFSYKLNTTVLRQF